MGSGAARNLQEENAGCNSGDERAGKIEEKADISWKISSAIFRKLSSDLLSRQRTMMSITAARKCLVKISLYRPDDILIRSDDILIRSDDILICPEAMT